MEQTQNLKQLNVLDCKKLYNTDGTRGQRSMFKNKRPSVDSKPSLIKTDTKGAFLRNKKSSVSKQREHQQTNNDIARNARIQEDMVPFVKMQEMGISNIE